MTKQQKNVLEAIVQKTLKTKGDKRGERKAWIDAWRSYDGRTLKQA